MIELKETVRASSVPEWADCQARAEYMVKRSGALPGRPHVGAVLGTMVHGMLLDKGADMLPLPDFIEWDQWTRNLKEMSRQAGTMYALALIELEARGWKIIMSEIEMARELYEPPVRLEVTGHMDAIISRPHELATLELKTGAHRPRGAWLQSGVYAWLWEGDASKRLPHGPIYKSAVLWLNRRNEDVTWEERETKPLRLLAAGQLTAIARAMVEGGTYNPSSLSCSSCLNTGCAVRYEGGLTSEIS